MLLLWSRINRLDEGVIPMAGSKKQTVHRSSVSGQFITEKEAKANPRESEKEQIKKPSK